MERPGPQPEENPFPDRLPDTVRTHEIANTMNAAYDQATADNLVGQDRERRMHEEAALKRLSIDTGVDYSRPELRRELAERTSPELVEEKRSAERAQEIDPKTGLGNEVALMKAMEVANLDPEIAVIMLDINNFGQVNKSPEGGNNTGNQEIIRAAEVIKSVIAHYPRARAFRQGAGADEFFILAPHAYAEAIRDAVEQEFTPSRYKTHEGETKIVSITGVISDPEPEPTAETDKIANADAKLQPAKRARKQADEQSELAG